MRRRGKPHRDWRRRFLERLAATGSVAGACAAAGVGRTTAYRHRWSDPGFAEDWDDAIEEFCDDLEEEAWRRARDGSDVLMMFMLKAVRPEKYRDHYPLKALIEQMKAGGQMPQVEHPKKCAPAPAREEGLTS
jgi:hypothetical protein